MPPGAARTPTELLLLVSLIGTVTIIATHGKRGPLAEVDRAPNESPSGPRAHELNRTLASAPRPPADSNERPQDPNGSQRFTSHRSPLLAEPAPQPGASSSSQLQPTSGNQAGSRRLLASTARPPTMSVSEQVGLDVASSLSNVRLKWRQMERSLGGALERASSDLRQTLDELLAQADGRRLPVSQGCRLAMDEFLSSLADQELWASQMFDASATGLPHGLLEGTLTELGHFDQCLAVASPGARPTFGQYCSLHIRPPLASRPRLHTICRRLPSPANSSSSSPVMKFLGQNGHQFQYVGLRLGICMPSKCSTTDVQHLLSSYLRQFELVGQVKYCQQQQRPLDQTANSTTGVFAHYLQLAFSSSSILQSFDLVQQCIVLTFGLLFVLTVLGTWLDTSHKRRKPSEHEPPPPPVTGRATGDLALKVAAATPARAEPPGWRKEYQVCRSLSAHSNLCYSDASLVAPLSSMHPNQLPSESQRRRLGLQRNPIAELVVVASGASASSTPPSSAASSLMLDVASQGELERANHARKQQAAALASGVSAERYNIDSTAAATHNNNNLIPAGHNAGSREYHADESADATGRRRNKSKFCQLLACFSLTSNLRTIGRQSRATAAGASTSGLADIKVIHGLRTLSMVWIVFGHTIGLVGPEMMNNLFPLAQLSCSSRLLQALLNTTLAVDTFFMISGLVTAISFVRKCRSAMVLIEESNGRVGGGGGGGECADDEHDPLVAGGGSSWPSSISRRPTTCVRNNDIEGNSAVSAGRREAAGCVSVIDLEEISSVDSASSAITSLSSSASSKRCIGGLQAAPATKKPNRAKAAGGKRSHKRAARHHHRRRRAATDQSEDSAATTTASEDAAAAAAGWPSDFKPVMWLLMRYLRLTPAYASVIGLCVLMPALGSGPFWSETVGQMGPACRSNWWLNLLYLNNFLETDRLCLIHSWYLSNDWQFFLLTLVLFATFYKSKRLALLLAVSLALASSAATFLATVENDFPPTIVTTSPAVAERWQFIHQLYYKPWPHLPSYLVGLLAGYLILRAGVARRASTLAQLPPDSRRQLSGVARYFCWTLFSLIGLATLNSIYPWNMGLRVDPLLAGLHSATFRTLWAACCAWLVYALVTRPRNPLALLLSWHGFLITSRLTYCAYLIHPLIIYYHFGTLRERLDSSPYGQLHRFMATLAQSYLFAFLLSLLVESPSIQLQRFFARLHEQSEGKPTGHRYATSRSENPPSSQLYENLTEQSWDSTGLQLMQDSCQLKQTHWAGANSQATAAGPPLAHSFLKPNLSSRSDPIRNDLPLDEQLIEMNNNNNNSQCELHPAKGRCSSESSCKSASSALDVEFQKRLAQAIGRGFKIRSKIVNGTLKGHQSPVRYQAARRLGPVKQRSSNQSRAQLSPIFAPEARQISEMRRGNNDEKTSSPQRLPPKLPPGGPTRRGDQLSTFGTARQTQQHYIRPTSRKTVEDFRSPLPPPPPAELGPLPASDQKLASIPPPVATDGSHTNTGLREMIQLKHKQLMSRQQDQHGKSYA